MKLTDHFIKKKIDRLAKKAPFRAHHYCSLEKAKRLLVVYNLNDQLAVEVCMDLLQTYHKEVLVCVYVPSGKTCENNQGVHLQINQEKDADMFHVPSRDICKQFYQLDADILIDLSRSSDHTVHYMMLNHPAPLKVGMKYEQTPLYDISIAGPKDQPVPQLFDHILYYLQTIKSN